MLNLVLFGPPGSGKGTQSEKLIEKYKLVHLSTGDILRSEIAAGTLLGLEAKSLMDTGALVPDEVVINMISNKIEANPNTKGFIFDGFPRTTSQAVALDDLLHTNRSEITLMLALEVSDEELTKRLLLRGKLSGRADDQNENIIKNRINEYNTKTAPLKIYYQSQNKFEAVNGVGSIEEIFNGLCRKIDAVVSSEVNESSFESNNDYIHTASNGQSHDDADVMVEEDVIVLREVTVKKSVPVKKKKKVVAKKKVVKLTVSKKAVGKKKKAKKKVSSKKKVKKIVSKKKAAKKKTTKKKNK